MIFIEKEYNKDFINEMKEIGQEESIPLTNFEDLFSD